MNLTFKNVFLSVGVFAFAFCVFGVSKVNAAADIAVASSKITSANTVLVTLVNPGQNIATVDATKWHIDAVDGGGASLTPASAAITSAGTPWTITLTFAGTPFSDTAKTYTAATGLYVDALGVTDANTPGDTNAVVGHAASTAITDGQVPVISSFSYRDNDVDGKIDQVLVTFSETLAAGSVMGANDLIFTDVGDFTGAAFGPLATDLTGAVASVTVPLGTEASALDTGDASGSLAISSRALFSLVDAAANTNAVLGPQAQATFVDLAKPQIRSITYQDASLDDSKMDRFDIIYTEPVMSGSVLRAADLALTAVGSFTSAVIGGATTDLISTDNVAATWLVLGTPSSVVATKDILGTLAISSQANFSLLDNSGNNNNTTVAQTQLSWTDGIKPIVLSTVPVNSSTSQSKSNPLSVVFSEAMNTSSLTSTATTPVNVPLTGTWSGDSITLSLAHNQFVGSTTYAVTLTGLNDVAGLELGATPSGTPYSWGFTTASGTSSSSSSSSSSSGGSSSSTTPAPAVVAPAVPANVETPEGCTDGAKFSTTTGKNCNAATPAVVCPAGQMFNTQTGDKCTTTDDTMASAPQGQAYAFGTTLVKQGTKGGACLAWQTFLNAHGANLATDGACGKLTMAAARSWQASVGLTADGLLGAMSRAKANTQ